MRSKSILCVILLLFSFVFVSCDTVTDFLSETTQNRTSITAGQDSDTQKDAENTQKYTDSSRLRFRTGELLTKHYKKHGIEMGFDNEREYEKAAARVVTDPNALYKTEKEDGDDVYYIEETNEFVVVSGDGYIRTYFCPDSGKKYFDRQ